jgi:hypothetical protein
MSYQDSDLSASIEINGAPVETEEAFAAMLQVICASCPLSVGQMIRPLAFVLADVATQARDGYDAVVERELVELVSELYRRICSGAADGANITIN